MPFSRNENIYLIRRNLIAAIEYFENTSQASNLLGINRQQLHKYISGLSNPSAQTLTQIGSYFNCDIDDFLLGESEFKSKIRAFSIKISDHPIVFENVNSLIDRASAQEASLMKYCGTYFAISTMPTLKNTFIRAVMRIYQADGVTYSTIIEVIGRQESSIHKKLIIRKSHAIILSHYERVYFFDISQEKRFSNIIIYAESLPVFSYLNGYIMTVSDYGSRRIFCVPLVLQRLPRNRVTKKYLRSCGIFNRDSSEIENEVRDRLSEFD